MAPRWRLCFNAVFVQTSAGTKGFRHEDILFLKSDGEFIGQ